MITIDSNNQIAMTRGDSWSAPIFINKGTGLKPLRYYLKDEDKVFLGIMEPNQPFENAIVKKVFTNLDENKNGDIVVRIDPDDTVLLIPGLYYYQIKARLYNDNKEIGRAIDITSNTIIKKDSKLLPQSKVNGTIITSELILDNDLSLSMGDKIAAGSLIKLPSVINNKQLEGTFDINTIVQKTKFTILE